LTQIVSLLDRSVSKFSVTTVKYFFSEISRYYKDSASMRSH